MTTAIPKTLMTPGKRVGLTTLLVVLGVTPFYGLWAEPAQSEPRTNEKTIGDFIASMGREAIGTLIKNGLTRSERFESFKRILLKNFAMDTIGSSLVNWSRWTEEQRTEYMRLLPDHLVNIFLSKFEKEKGKILTDDTFKVNRVFKRNSTNPDSSYSVNTTITLMDSPQTIVDWKVSETKDGLKILDVRFEGLSMIKTKTEEFKGKDVQALFEMLKNVSTHQE